MLPRGTYICMKIIELSRNQIIDIYSSKMVNDFPADELRPLKMITGPYDKGIYKCYAIVDKSDEGDILGYAYFVKNDNHYLFDYLAISDEKRGSGIGSAFLSLLREQFANSESVIGEVEDPDYAENDADKDIQTRRLNFYLRNGYINTNVKVKLFGVDYIVLEMDLNKTHSEKEIIDLYNNHYRTMLPKKLFDSMVHIK